MAILPIGEVAKQRVARLKDPKDAVKMPATRGASQPTVADGLNQSQRNVRARKQVENDPEFGIKRNGKTGY